MPKNQNKHSTIILFTILASYMMIVLDISITITGLPKIQQEFGFSFVDLSWVQSIYALVFGGLLLLGARLGDIIGRKKVFMIGIGIFIIASVGVGFAWSGIIMLFFRAVQGIGAAILAPSTLALISANFPSGEQRTKAVAYYGAVAGVSSSVGLVLGGVLAGVLSWRIGFLINLPIGIIVLIASKHYLNETERNVGKFDIIGAVTSTFGMFLIVYGILHSADFGWFDSITVTSLLLGISLLILFVKNEKRVSYPILPLRLFSSSVRIGAYLSRIFFLGGMLGFWFFIAQYLEEVKGYSAALIGVTFLATTIPNFIMAMTIPALTRKFSNSRILVFGLVVSVIGMFWLSRLTAESSIIFSLILPMILIGIGQGGVLAPLTKAGMSGVRDEDVGAASGLVNTTHQLGGSLGLSILVNIFSAANTTSIVGNELFTYRVSAALTTGSIMLVSSLLSVLIFNNLIRSNENGK